MAAVDGAPTSAHALSQFVLKVHSRCDLACDHCYVYEHEDQSWRGRPRVMAPQTVRAAASRVAEHAAIHRLRSVCVVLHGGEPLLLGHRGLRDVVAELRATVDPVTRLDLRMQSNGVRLTEAMCELLVEYDVRVGISLDGGRSANDLHRRFASGASSHAETLRALDLLRRPEYRRAYAGILCTVDIRNDPGRVYEALLAERPPRIDLLLPHATWDRPPLRPDGDPTPYAHWLLGIYERWIADGRPVPIRLFDSLLSTAVGGPSGSEWVGLDPADLAVVETDGAWEMVDSLKTAYDGAPATGLNVFDHSVDEVAALPGIVRRQTGLDDLCATCRACPVVGQCGGGLFAHRYRSESGFDNPSVYCADLKTLIRGVNDRRPRVDTAPPADGDGVLDPEVLDDIASGFGDAGTVAYLANSQLTITRELLVALSARLPRGGPGAGAWQLLIELDHVVPETVADVLRHPYVRVWAVQQLRQSWPLDESYLCGLAAAAAIRGGQDAEVRIPVGGTTLYLPTLGTVALPTSAGDAVSLTTSSGWFAIRSGTWSVSIKDFDMPADGWRPAHRVALRERVIWLEDGDPYRDCHDWRASGPLSDDAVRRWSDAIVRAVDTIGAQVPRHVPGVSVALRMVTPLQAATDGTLRSSTARHAFGAVAVALADEDAVATMLVHEFQHTKLGAVLDVVDLFDPQAEVWLTVGWRSDPRPIEGVLQGTYAHLAVADIWRERAVVRGGHRPEAAGHFVRYREWTAEAIRALRRSGALTPLGLRFVDRMAAAMDEW